MAKLFSEPNLPPVRSTAAQSIMQGAQAQAQMYSSLGQALGKVANTYFEKKDEDKQIESLAQDERVLNAIYGGRKDASGMPVMPTDFKEVKKDVKALFKGLGGRVGVENYLLRDRAEQRAASAEQRAEDMLAIQQEKHENIQKQERLRNEVLMEAFSSKKIPLRLEGEMFPKGGTVGDMFPGLKPQPMGEPSPSAYIPTVPQRNVVTGEVTQPQGEPSYLSQLKSGIRTAREKLADVELPDIPLAKEVTVEGKMPFQERSMEGVIESLQKSGLGQEHMPYILELAKLRPSRASLGSIGISEALGDRTFLSEAEAANEYRRVARENDYTPTQAGIDNFVKTARVVDPAEIKKQVTADLKRLGLGEPLLRMRKLEEVKDMLDEAKESPTAGIAAVLGFARVFEPVGILTESDIARWGGADKSLTSEFMRLYLKADEGKELLPGDIEDLERIRKKLETSVKGKLSAEIPEITKNLTGQYNLSEEKIREITYLSNLMPKDAGQPSGDPSDLADDIYQNIRKQPVGSKIELPLHGSGQIIAHFPNGIIHVKLDATGRIHELDGKNLNATPEPPPPRNPRIQKTPEFDPNDPDVRSYKFK